MVKTGSTFAQDTSFKAIMFILVGMLFITLNDSLIKFLGGDYPLHQLVFFRSIIALIVTLFILQFEGGVRELRTSTPLLHLIRGLLVVAANLLYFSALAVLPLGTAVALFFVAPLVITVFSVLFLQEHVGLTRWSAIGIGLMGVVIMTFGEMHATDDKDHSWWLYSLPIGAAVAYAGMQVMTRFLGSTAKASALAVYIQGVFILVSGMFYLVLGDGQYVHLVDHPSLVFVLRAWIWPPTQDIGLLVLLGLSAGGVGYTLSAAYKYGNAATVSSYEYTALPLAFLSGCFVFGEVLSLHVGIGAMLIASAGIIVFYRERKKRSPVSPRRAIRRG